MKPRYRVEVETRIVTPVTVEADDPLEAIELALLGRGDIGQAWYEEPPRPKVCCLGVDDAG